MDSREGNRQAAKLGIFLRCLLRVFVRALTFVRYPLNLELKLTVGFRYLLIVVIRTAMIESGYHATSHFLTALVFERFFYLVGDIMIVAIIARTILEDMGSGTGKLASFSNGLIGLLWMLAIIAFNFYAAFCGQFIAIGGVSNITNEGSKYTAVFYSAYIFVISMYLAILACMAVIKRRSKVYYYIILNTLAEESITNRYSGHLSHDIHCYSLLIPSFPLRPN